MKSDKVIRLLYPRVCPICGEILSASSDLKRLENIGNPYICEKCYGKLDFAENVSRCLKCSRPLESSDSEYCRDCLEKDRGFDRGISAMLHGEQARKAIYDLKYNNLKDNADFLALEAVRRTGIVAERFGADIIIPVPLHKSRLKIRGYNQAKVLADKYIEYGELLGLNLPPCDNNYLKRTEKTSALKELTGAQRRAAIMGAFTVTGEYGKYKKVIVFDDIFTTGATVGECANTLIKYGAEKVYFITVSIGS